MMPILLALALLIVCIYAFWTSTFWRRWNIKGPCGFPLFGNMLQFCLGRKHYGEVYQDIYNAYPELTYVGIYRVFNEPAILVRDIEMVKDVMVRNFHYFQDNVLWVNAKRDPTIRCNPFAAKGEKWKPMRSEIVPIFTPNKIKASFAHIESVCRQLENYIEKNLHVSLEAKNLCAKYTLNVVASAALGIDAECLTADNSKFTKLFANIFQPSFISLIETIALLFSPRLGDLIGYHYVPKQVQNWITAVVNDILSKRIYNPDPYMTYNDFVQWLLEAKKKSNEPIDALTIIGHSSTFLLEGFETSSSLMAYALLEYSLHPEIQKRVLQEIDDVLEKHNGDMSYAALQEMVYLEATLLETLRMHAPMSALLKHCTKPFQLPPQTQKDHKSFTAQTGTIFVIPVQAIHYDPTFYPEPTVFKPERFLETNSIQKSSCTFLGFGEGPRMCPGMKFGLIQSKAGLVSLLAKHTVHYASDVLKTPTTAATTFLTATEHGIWINFQKR